MDENNEAPDTVSEILKVFKSLSWDSTFVTTMCCLRAIRKKTKRQHGIPKGPRINA